eukprot:m.32327 g.32327  ORF g.32327 m.32327 type:complete len:343 (+) comp4983_c0_seq1:17-1045(+)
MSHLLVLSDGDVRRALPVQAAIDCNRRAFLHSADYVVPQRIILSLPIHAGATLFKPCWEQRPDGGGALGIKLVSVRPQNAAHGMPTVPASVVLLDEATGATVAIMNGTYLTAIRTAAGSAIAADLLAAPAASSLVLFGAGLQSEAHAMTVCAVRSVARIAIVNRTPATGGLLADRLHTYFAGHPGGATSTCPAISVVSLADTAAVNDVVSSADIIVTASNSAVPLFDGTKLRAGTCVLAVGSYQPASRELDTAVLRRAGRIIVDSEEALAVGEFALARADGIDRVPHALTLGHALADSAALAVADGDIALYKSVGTALQDIATARAVYEAALQGGLGTKCSL